MSSRRRADRSHGPRPKAETATIAVGAVAVLSLAAAATAIFTDDGPGPVEAPVLAESAVHTGVGVPEGFTDPRGPDRGPSSLEWEVIRVYKVIETMTADQPPVADVERALQRLRRYADENTDNPFIHETYLKGLRVAEYYADPQDPTRILSLHERFVTYAAQWEHYEHVVIETMWYRLDRIQAARARCGPEVAELERLYALVPDIEEAERAFLCGLRDALDSKCKLTPSELALWEDRLIKGSLLGLDDTAHRWLLRAGVRSRFRRALTSGDIAQAREALAIVEPLVNEYPDDFASDYERWVQELEQHRPETS